MGFCNLLLSCFCLVLLGFVKSIERANKEMKTPPQISLNTFKVK